VIPDVSEEHSASSTDIVLGEGITDRLKRQEKPRPTTRRHISEDQNRLRHCCDNLKCRDISGFLRDVHEICALLGCYAASSGNSVPTFRDDVSVQSLRVKKSKKNFSTLEDETDRLYRNVGTELPLSAALISQKSSHLKSRIVRPDYR
jgi:hypothetical protein